MAARQLIKMGNPLLRVEAEDVPLEEITSEETRDLIQDMFETMNIEQGIGLAAPQIGVSKKIAIIGIPENSERYPDTEASPLIIVFNPKITILDEETQGCWEGCLSVPGLRGYVERPRKVQIDFYDQNAEIQTIVAEGFLATVLQHELDHLFGHLFLDKMKDMTKLAYLEEFRMFHTSDQKV